MSNGSREQIARIAQVKKSGRKSLTIDPTQVEKLAALQCSHAEIGAVLGCSADTLERRFAAAIKKGRERGKVSLKRAQFKLALSGNPTMQIWLGKIYLDQHENSVKVEVSAPVPPERIVQSDTTKAQDIAEMRRLLKMGAEAMGVELPPEDEEL